MTNWFAKMYKRIVGLVFLILLIVPFKIVTAQDTQPSGPVYVVQSGDTFYSIAVKFGVTVDDIVKANPSINPNALSVGAEVVIPGMQGVSGKLLTETIPLGETLRTLSIHNQITSLQVAQLNRITSPAEVYAGASLIIPQQDNIQSPQSQFLLGQNQSLFQVAIQQNLNPWLLAEVNQLSSTWDILPGETVYDQVANNPAKVSLISPVISEIAVDPLPIQQGETAEIKITTTQPVDFSGSLANHDLHFFPNGANTYVALQGVYGMADPGIYPFTLLGKLKDGTQFSFEQMVVLQALGYPTEKINGVASETLDPAVTKPEDDMVSGIVAKATPEKYWSGVFKAPGYDPNWITDWYGSRRSYNGGPVSAFHTGVDYGGGIGLPIKAAASGVVVYTGLLSVRGNATIIDHGWGIYTGYYHQSEIKVKVGDKVEAGQEIGIYGATGRVTGPHLHWDLFVNGVQVNPLTWLDKVFP